MVISTGKQRVRINESIRAQQIRLIDSEGKQVGVVPLAEALERAAAVNLDLVEISPNTDPVVCKIMDYGKFIFQAQKKQTAAKKKQKRTQIKKLRLRPSIEEGDYQVKLRNLTRFLNDGCKVEISLRFRGREMAHQDSGMTLMKRLAEDLKEIADLERDPTFESRQLFMVLAPKKAKA